MTDEIVVSESVRLGTLEIAPTGVIARATLIATELAALVNARKLYVPISGKKYVRVEGWSTLGAMLGVTPREVSTTMHEDGTFEAMVEIVRSDGQVVGRGSAICGMDEPTWSKRPAYARRSMAITRATGKAFRLAYSWIMTLAGYEATPAEEVVDAESRSTIGENDVDKDFPPQPEAAHGPSVVVGPSAKVPAHVKGMKIMPQDILDQGLSESVQSASWMVNKLLLVNKPLDEGLEICKLYRRWRISGLEAKDAAVKTLAKEQPQSEEK